MFRTLSVVVSVGALAFAGSAFAKAKPNCDINGKQVHYKSKKTCEKKNGKWLEGDASATSSATSTSSATTPATAPASTSPAATTK